MHDSYTLFMSCVKRKTSEGKQKKVTQHRIRITFLSSRIHKMFGLYFYEEVQNTQNHIQSLKKISAICRFFLNSGKSISICKLNVQLMQSESIGNQTV